MTSLCLCCDKEFRARYKNQSLKKNQYINQANPNDPRIIVEQDIRLILRLVGGNNLDFIWKIML